MNYKTFFQKSHRKKSRNTENFYQTPQKSRKMSEALPNASEVLCSITQVLRRTPELLRRLWKVLRNMSEVLRNILKLLRHTSETLRKPAENLRHTPQIPRQKKNLSTKFANYFRNCVQNLTKSLKATNNIAYGETIGQKSNDLTLAESEQHFANFLFDTFSVGKHLFANP